jgi:hypothetical protein
MLRKYRPAKVSNLGQLGLLAVAMETAIDTRNDSHLAMNSAHRRAHPW